ncbi:MAG TPA: hypothetical protein VM598_00945, partial [Bdellovibrionota bacterium]|nr:hypothetical protein [Bdellovibrionota bacterium]
MTLRQHLEVLIKSTLAVILLAGGSLYGCGYYFFRYPTEVANRAIASVRLGQDLAEVLAPDSEFMLQLAKSRADMVSF